MIGSWMTSYREQDSKLRVKTMDAEVIGKYLCTKNGDDAQGNGP